MNTETKNDTGVAVRFADLQLSEAVNKALLDVGYETPSPIQAAIIPSMLAGRDVLGQAQTGTGKTAAFALPLLTMLDATAKKPQALVLAPTRELAIQVAEAFQKYAHHLPGFHVLPIYGGQSYYPQLQALKRGVQVVVGTPGRVIDHLERGSLDLSDLKCLVLDEADEMLRMGFIDDVETVLKKTPSSRQVALFSATMPAPIKRIAQTYLNDPVEVSIKTQTVTSENIRQRYWVVSGVHKLDAITRIIEAEPFDAMIVFARTKQMTEELADKLAARGVAAAAINGDIQQAQRERTIQSLKDGKIDVLVATDVAARGLDVERITHVLNYDIPYDTESYVHRIGRTGRAGRQGDAILFVAPRERGMLRTIERATRKPIEPMDLPTVADVNTTRVERFLSQISDSMGDPSINDFRSLVERYAAENGVEPLEVAAALGVMAQGKKPLLMPEPAFEPKSRKFYDDKPRREREPREAREPREPRAKRSNDGPETGMQTYRVEVGHVHGVRPGNLVGAIANEANLESKYIGRIDLRDDYSLVDLPEGMPPEVTEHLQDVWVAGQKLKIRLASEQDREYSPAPRRRFNDKDGPSRGGFKPGPGGRGGPGGKRPGGGFKPGGGGGRPRRGDR